MRYWQLYGILWSTIIALVVVELPWLMHNIFSILYDRSYRASYLIKLLRFSLGGLIAWGLTMLLANVIHLNTWAQFVVNGIIAVLLPSAIYLLAYRHEEEYQSGMALLDKATNYRLPLRRLYNGGEAAQ